MEDQAMIIGERLLALREQKNFSQGEVEKRTGLLRPELGSQNETRYCPL